MSGIIDQAAGYRFVQGSVPADPTNRKSEKRIHHVYVKPEKLVSGEGDKLAEVADRVVTLRDVLDGNAITYHQYILANTYDYKANPENVTDKQLGDLAKVCITYEAEKNFKKELTDVQLDSQEGNFYSNGPRLEIDKLDQKIEATKESLRNKFQEQIKTFQR